LKELLDQPEYLHLLVIPFLTHALPVAALALLVALIARRPAAVSLALGLVTLCAAAAWPAVEYGEHGYDRIQSVADQTGGEWLDVHRHRAEHMAWAFHAAAIAAFAALLVSLRWPGAGIALGWVALLGAVLACAVAFYVAYPAGRIRHRELRHADPPAAELESARREYAPAK
jgi:hypothetical protein